MKKKIFSFISVIILLMGINTTAFAADNVLDNENKEVDYSIQFEQFIKEALEKRDSFCVYNNQDEDVTIHFLEVYYNEGIEKAHEYVKKNKCTLSYQVIEENDIESHTTIKARNVHQFFYECETCTDGIYTKEWRMKLTGIYSYNADTGAITSARNPTLSIDYANFGAAWIAYMNNVSTSYTITGTKSIKFTGKYHMYGQCSPPGFDGASFTKDFRSHTVSFTSNE